MCEKGGQAWQVWTEGSCSSVELASSGRRQGGIPDMQHILAWSCLPSTHNWSGMHPTWGG